VRAGALASSQSEPGLGGTAKSFAESRLRYREMLLLEGLGGQASRRARAFAVQRRKSVDSNEQEPSSAPHECAR